MKRLINHFLVLFSFLFLVSCEKDQFNPIPEIQPESLSSSLETNYEEEFSLPPNFKSDYPTLYKKLKKDIAFSDFKSIELFDPDNIQFDSYGLYSPNSELDIFSFYVVQTEENVRSNFVIEVQNDSYNSYLMKYEFDIDEYGTVSIEDSIDMQNFTGKLSKHIVDLNANRACHFYECFELLFEGGMSEGNNPPTGGGGDGTGGWEPPETGDGGGFECWIYTIDCIPCPCVGHYCGDSKCRCGTRWKWKLVVEPCDGGGDEDTGLNNNFSGETDEGRMSDCLEECLELFFGFEIITNPQPDYTDIENIITDIVIDEHDQTLILCLVEALGISQFEQLSMLLSNIDLSLFIAEEILGCPDNYSAISLEMFIYILDINEFISTNNLESFLGLDEVYSIIGTDCMGYPDECIGLALLAYYNSVFLCQGPSLTDFSNDQDGTYLGMIQETIDLLKAAGYDWFPEMIQDMIDCEEFETVGDLRDTWYLVKDFVSEANQFQLCEREQEVAEWMMAIFSPENVGTILAFATFGQNMSASFRSKFRLYFSSKSTTLCFDLSKGFNTFSEYKSAYGAAGQGKAWHHIVEQNAINSCNFPGKAIHHPNNLIKIEGGFSSSWHSNICSIYQTYGYFDVLPANMSLRQWLVGKPFEVHFEWGMKVLNLTKP